MCRQADDMCTMNQMISYCFCSKYDLGLPLSVLHLPVQISMFQLCQQLEILRQHLSRKMVRLLHLLVENYVVLAV